MAVRSTSLPAPFKNSIPYSLESFVTSLKKATLASTLAAAIAMCAFSPFGIKVTFFTTFF